MMADGQQRTLSKLRQVTTVVHAVRDENFALAAALKAKGVALPQKLDPTHSYVANLTGSGGSGGDAAAANAHGAGEGGRAGKGKVRAAAVGSADELTRYLERGAEQGNKAATKVLRSMPGVSSRLGSVAKEQSEGGAADGASREEQPPDGLLATAGSALMSALSSAAGGGAAAGGRRRST